MIYEKSYKIKKLDFNLLASIYDLNAIYNCITVIATLDLEETQNKSL